MLSSQGSRQSRCNPRRRPPDTQWTAETREFLFSTTVRIRTRGSLYPQKFALTSPTNGGSSVCIIHARIQATEQTASRPSLGPSQPSAQWVQGAPSPGIKRREREVDHWPTPSAQVKNDGTIPPLRCASTR
jgi:hypothetical protein